MNTKKGLTSRERLNQNNKRIFDLQTQNNKLSPDDGQAAVNTEEIIALQQENADAVSKNPELNFADVHREPTADGLTRKIQEDEALDNPTQWQ